MRIPEVRCVILLLLAAGVVPMAGAQATVGKITQGKAKLAGTSVLGGGSYPVYGTVTIPHLKPDYDLGAARLASVSGQAASNAGAIAASLAIPAPKPNSVNYRPANVGFTGLTTVDTANATGYVTTPPDQGLCAGHGFVMEMINSSLVVFNDAGARVSTPEAVDAFFLANPNTDFISDPRCYYDPPTQRWFASVTNVLDSVSGRSNLSLAVSQTSDPRGAYFVYTIDTTDDGVNGTPANAGCTTASPCFGDQPTLGADRNGVYLTTNEFGVFSNVFNGAQIYAISKAALEAGTANSLVHFGNLPLAEGIAYSVQPASSPDLNEEEGSGTEYFLSALDFLGTLDNRIAVWAITDTSSLNRPTPSVTLLQTIVSSEVYGQPPNAPQKAGPYPLGQSLGEPEEMLSSGDDRMQNTVYASGHLWGGLNTVVSDGTNVNAGIAYFDVRPSVSRRGLSATVQGQSYVSLAGNSVIYPGIGVTADGTAAAAFTVSGASYYPSAAYAHLTPSHATSVDIVALGTAPQDDFSGYPEFGGDPGVARWGDYAWGVADGGSLWLATEYIPGGIDPVSYYTDFGTYVYKINLD
ncbi:MAG TPA: hypothetical protein VGG85_01195 [Terracidiphilus sp.]|jgi:hypothetical protein